MVAFQPFRKSKTDIISSRSYEHNSMSNQAVTGPQICKPPVLRNFSYPTKVGANAQVPSYPPVPRAGQTTWDQLGEICNFSPDKVGTARTAGLDEPFYYKRDLDSYIELTDHDSDFSTRTSTSTQLSRVPDHRASTNYEPRPKKKQRRSALLGSLSLLHIQSKPVTSEDGGTWHQRDKSHKASKSLTIRDHISQKTSMITGLKHHSLGQSEVVSQPCESPGMPQRGNPERPTSISGVPLIDTRPENSSPVLTTRLPSAVHRRTNTRFSLKEDVMQLLHPKSSSECQTPKMESFRRRSAPQGLFRFGTTSTTNNPGKDSDITNEGDGNAKGGKSKWLSQLKGWITVSEPSIQALKRHKKDIYQKAGIALDDPRASAKLHLPIGMLPSEAIKPSGWGPEPEEAAMRKAEQNNKLQQSYNSSMSTSQGSRSSSSQHSSSSSVATSSIREDMEC